MRLGIERFEDRPPALTNKARLGVLSNSASINADWKQTWQIIDHMRPGSIQALFTPQHGFWRDAQANMIETGHGWHPKLEVPLYSLYSETRRPTLEMLESIDWLIIDLQDVGTRVYTFIWTMLECLRQCAEANVSVLVLDRPNPLGGCIIEGPILDSRYQSFVGGAQIPMRHGLTMAELALLFRQEEQLDVELHVVPMEDWKLNCTWEHTGRHWIPPSPNLPTLRSVTLYPGQVLLEGTNLSEGRGTTQPFEYIGAPYIHSEELANRISASVGDDVRVLPTQFCPTFDKWAGLHCEGISIHIVDADKFRPFAFTVKALEQILATCPEFDWIEPPYEYEERLKPIDILFGNSSLRENLGKVSFQALTETPNIEAWRTRTASVILYGSDDRCFSH